MKPTDLLIEKALVVSTGHISLACVKALEGGCSMQGDYGFLIHTESRCLDDPDLKSLTKLARQNGCCWLMLDRDGPEIEGYPTYEW